MATRGNSNHLAFFHVVTNSHTGLGVLSYVHLQRASGHKCGGSGTITIRTKEGEVEAIRFLRGHHAKNYEYRYSGRINRVNRIVFMDALKVVGLTQITK